MDSLGKKVGKGGASLALEASHSKRLNAEEKRGRGNLTQPPRWGIWGKGSEVTRGGKGWAN